MSAARSLRGELADALEDRGLERVAADVGVSEETITRLAEGYPVSEAAHAAALRWLDDGVRS